MNAGTIDSVMRARGLASDPAFQDLTFLIEPIPCISNICPLGEYSPETSTIVLPPDADESVLLHELGHRYGDFYHHDLSEEFAWAFSTRYGLRVVLFVPDGSDLNCPCGARVYITGPEIRCPNCSSVYRRVG